VSTPDPPVPGPRARLGQLWQGLLTQLNGSLKRHELEELRTYVCVREVQADQMTLRTCYRWMQHRLMHDYRCALEHAIIATVGHPLTLEVIVTP
jgi:hypothetical protein